MLLKLLSWLLRKLAAAALIVGLGLGAYGLWIFVQQKGILEQERAERLEQAMAERNDLLATDSALERQVTIMRAEIENQKARYRQAEKVIARLHELESSWDRWWPWSGQKKQQVANADQVTKMEDLKVDSSAKWAELQKTLANVSTQKDAVSLALGHANDEVDQLDLSRSRVRHYVVLAWGKTKWAILIALAAYFLGPTLWAFSMYCFVAPFMSRGRPLQLGPSPTVLPEAVGSRASIETVLGPGEILRVKEKYLQASGEGLGKSTRMLLDWRIPFTSVVAGLTRLVELRSARPDGEERITLSNAAAPDLELAEVHLPAGSSLIVRPSFLAGVVQPKGDRFRIRRHWRLFWWQSWVSGQFRFLEFVGPCRLFVVGSPAVRAERLTAREGATSPARRTTQDATIGFSPHLEYRPIRAETFGSYYRGINPLFDDLFTGHGICVVRTTEAKAARFRSSVRNRMLKLFGL